MSDESPRAGFPWRPLLVLAGCAAFALFIWLGPEQMTRGMDLCLHGSASFVLVLGGNYILWAKDRRYAEWEVFAVALSIGVLLEAAQFYLHTDFQASDTVVDLTGCVAGWAVWRIVRPMLERERT